MFTNEKLNRRNYLKGMSLGAGGLLFAPLLQKVAAAANGNVTPPKRFIFFLFDNGFQESGSIPTGWKRGADAIRQESLKGAELPRDIAAFAPFQDRMTIVQGLQGRHCARGHGSHYGALAGVNSPANGHLPKAQTIDAAVAKAFPGIFPHVGLGIAAGTSKRSAYATSAWGPGSPIAIQCRPELAYQSLFGSIGATGNDFLERKNLLDSISEDVRSLRSQIAGPEKELVEHHFGALESLSKRDGQMAQLQEAGTLRRKAPKMPATPPKSMVDISSAQCDVAAAALISGLTNVVTITSGLGWIGTNYTGITPTVSHHVGHGSTDPVLEVPGLEVMRRYREHLTTQAAGVLKKLQATPEGKGTMLDNTVLVFTSDCAETQHTKGDNWPFVLVGDLGGSLQTGQYVSYTMSKGGQNGKQQGEGVVTPTDNPAINALYCSLLHAAGAPRDAFNAGATDLAVWRRVYEQIMDEEMPPEDEDQFSKAEREKTLAWLADTLEAHSDLNLTPAAANYVDHDALFSGKPAGDPATRARVWRLPGKTYEALIRGLAQDIGVKLPDYIGSYVTRQNPVLPPWGRDGYSTADRIDEAELEAHMRTCAFVLSQIMPKVEKNQLKIRSLHPVYKAGKNATAAQVQAAVTESFKKILRQAPEPREMQQYRKLLANNLKTHEPLKAVERFLNRMLFHPSLLYRVETPIAGSQRSIMPPRQLARAIAYSLTYSEPDEGLRKAMAAGKLSTREDVRREVERLVTATTPYGLEVSLTADQRAKLDALNREYWQIKTPEARKAANYKQKLGKAIGAQAGRWMQLQKAGYRSMDGEQINLTKILRPRVLSFFQSYFRYKGAPFKCQVTVKELNVIKSGNGGWSATFEGDTDRLVDWVLQSDKEVLRTLLTTRKTFVTARHTSHGSRGLLKSHTDQIGELQKWKYFQAALQTYEISMMPEQWLLGKEEPVDMPKGRRMGILTHPSWLVAHSGNFDNDAIHRGKWIHEKLLGGRVPDVPITVDAKLPDEPHNTLRERMRVTRAEQCIKCHNRMDALGLTFEQFDHFGRNRSAEIVVDKEKTAKMKKRSADTPRIMTSKPFDTTGHVYYSGDKKVDGPVKDVFELIEKLAHSERVEQVFVRHVFRYFMGRNETLADGPTLVAAHKAYRENGGSFNALLVSLLTSDSFLYRTLPADREGSGASREPVSNNGK